MLMIEALNPLPCLYAIALSFPFPSFLSFCPFALKVGSLESGIKGLRERCKLFQWGLGSGAEPQPKLNLVHFSVKYDIW